MSSKYAATTEVGWEKSRAEIERNLQRYGAARFGYGSEDRRAVIMFEARGRRVRMVLPLPSRDDDEIAMKLDGRGKPKDGPKMRPRPAREAENAYNQAVRQRWRALSLVVLAKLEAIESGIATFDAEFLAYVVLPSGQTVAEWAEPHLAKIDAKGLPPMLPGGR